MKKMIAILLAAASLFTLCACGSSSATSTADSSAAKTEVAAESSAETVVTASAAAAVEPAEPEKTKAKVVETGSGITVKQASEWAKDYPDVYASYLKNEENTETTDYVKDYPMIGKVYEGMAFNSYYSSARGHSYTITDITETGRPHKLANCFTCKSPDCTALVNNNGDSAYSMVFEDAAASVTEPIGCYNCHANDVSDLTVTHTYLADALGDDFESIDPANLSCAQCHVEYYFDPATKATKLPYSDLDTMTPEAMLDFYNNRLITDGQNFADYTNPRTGVRQIKVQHPEFETFYGEGSVHKDDFTCADCHMGEAVAEDGSTYVNHYLTSPLENETVMATCAECHSDLKTEVREIQTEIERRTYAIGYELEALTEKLAGAVESGRYTDEQLANVRSLARDAQFYWDFVFVENSEGAHNSDLDTSCLDKAEELCSKALTVFAGIEPSVAVEEVVDETAEAPAAEVPAEEAAEAQAEEVAVEEAVTVVEEAVAEDADDTAAPSGGELAPLDVKLAKNVEAVYSDGSGRVVSELHVKGAFGNIVFMVGIDGNRKIDEITVQSHNESEKGAPILEADSLAKYVGAEDENAIDAVSGATKTSDALKKAVKYAFKQYDIVNG